MTLNVHVVTLMLLFSGGLGLDGNNILHPTFFLNGVNGEPEDFIASTAVIDNVYPGSWWYCFTEMSAYDTWQPLNHQIQVIMESIRRIVAQNETLFEDGYNLICHSQGGLLCRCLIEEMDDHNVRTFISLASPQEGVYGWSYLLQRRWFATHPWLTTFIAEMIMRISHSVMYSTVFQNFLNVGNIWHDPLHEDMYLAKNVFLPKYNGVTNHSDLPRFKENFIRVQKAVFLVGKFNESLGDTVSPHSEGAVEPYHSGIFGYYVPGTNDTYQTMEERRLYQEDLFGLRTLDEEGRLYTKAVWNISHDQWVMDSPTFETYVLPHLT